MRILKTPALAITACAALAACTTNPYTGEQQASKTATYGLGAAAVCGLVGAMDSSKKARNAALGCGIVGAGVGAYMDVQEARLREQLQGTGVQVVREGDNIRLIMPGNITFNTDSYELRASFYPVLNSVGLVLAKYADTTLRITGHTDNTGSEAYNEELGYRRALTVRDYMSMSGGIPLHAMNVISYGESKPLADNSTPEGRAQNRRVELYILPKTA